MLFNPNNSPMRPLELIKALLWNALTQLSK